MVFLYETQKGKMLETATKNKSCHHSKEQDPAFSPSMVYLAVQGLSFRLNTHCTESLLQTQQLSHAQ